MELSLHEVEDELCPSSEEAMEAVGEARGAKEEEARGARGAKEEGEAKRKRERSTTPVQKKKKWPSGEQVSDLILAG